LYAAVTLLAINKLVEDYARRKEGEVVEPAGGETGEPHYLAEVHKLLKSSIIFIF